jgi:ribonucleoside-diphosphate reductase alpha chain
MSARISNGNLLQNTCSNNAFHTSQTSDSHKDTGGFGECQIAQLQGYNQAPGRILHSRKEVPISQPVNAAPARESRQQEDLSRPPAANRHRLPDERVGRTHHFSIAGHEGYLTVGLYPNGQPGEIFIRMAKEGSTIAGLMECFGTVVSVSLQHGVPLKVLCDKLSHTRFEPSGWTGNEELGYAKSIMDYLFRWMELRFLSGKQLPLFTQQMAVVERQGGAEASYAPASVSQYLHDSCDVGDAPLCVTCGSLMVRNGSCHKCANCGGTSGCS